MEKPSVTPVQPSVSSVPPLLLLHGFTGDRSTWDGLAPRLPGYKLIAPDLPGHGKSDSQSYEMPRVAADIIDLLDSLDIARAHLLGYSMGGRLALFMALAYPRRFLSLTLESASPGIADDNERIARRLQDDRLAHRIETRGIGWFVDFWESLPMWASQARLPERVLSAQRQQRLRNDPTGLAKSLRGMGTGAQPSLWNRLGELGMPTRLVVGELDSKFRRFNTDMAARIPNAKLSVIPAAGHNTHLENPAAFARVVVGARR